MIGVAVTVGAVSDVVNGVGDDEFIVGGISGVVTASVGDGNGMGTGDWEGGRTSGDGVIGMIKMVSSGGTSSRSSKLKYADCGTSSST